MTSRLPAAPNTILGRAALAAIALGTVLVLLLALPVSRSAAAPHLTVTGEYGMSGPKASGIGNGCGIAWENGSQDLYLLTEQKIYGLAITVGNPGSATPLTDGFPINAEIGSYCNGPSIAVDNSGSGNIYASFYNTLYGWKANGQPLGGRWPVPNGTETCGVTVTGSGEVWSSTFNNSFRLNKFDATGVSQGNLQVGFYFCRIIVDPTTGDLYVAPYEGSNPIVKFSAASGYTEKTTIAPAGYFLPGLAINGLQHKLYVGNGTSTVKAYDTRTGALIESIDLGAEGGLGLAVDEATDTLFAAVGTEQTGEIKEFFGSPTPKATTGEPTGNMEVSGTADPNGVGPITACYFEYGLSRSYGSKVKCDEPTPISSTETVHATLPNLVGGEAYHYRLVLANAEPNVIGKGADETIVAAQRERPADRSPRPK